MTIKKTYQYRIYFNKTKEKAIHQILENCSWLYNHLLTQFRERDQKGERQTTKIQLQNSLISIKKNNSFLRQTQSHILQDVAKRVYKTWQNYQRLKGLNPKKKYPNFKPIGRYYSFTYSQPIAKKGCGYIIDNSPLLKKSEMRDLKLTLGRQNNHNVYLETSVCLSRNIEGEVKNLTIKKKNGKYYSLFSCDNIQLKPLPKTNKKVGLDLGIGTLITTSRGKRVKNPKFYQQTQNTLKKAQQYLSHKVQGSHNWLDAKLQLAKKWEKLVNQFRHYSYQQVNELVKEYDDIAIENLDVKGMLKKKTGDNKKSLRRSLAGVKFGILLKVISDKASIAGRRLVRVNPRNTTQTCSNCGELSREKIKLNQRVFECWNCDYKVDRDMNSAKNIYQLGFDRNLPLKRGKEL
ncbi:MAG: transposase IS605 [Mycoplasmataceae bacterium RV_VA103A]|nr:MAG: transposase IS605 [Mycoplasmataceae bacterium RV_VA103A]